MSGAETKATSELLDGLRATERLSVGRQILSIVAIIYLANENRIKPTSFTTIDTESAEHLHQLTATIEAPYREIMLLTILPEVERSSLLPEMVNRAYSVVDVLRADQLPLKSFAKWFDATLDVVTEVGPISADLATSRSLAKLMVLTAGVRKRATVFDPSCGQGTLLSAAREVNPAIRLFGQEINQFALGLAELRLALFDANIELSVGDSLNELPRTARHVDCVLCDPPLGDWTFKARAAEMSLTQEINYRRVESRFVALCAGLLKSGGTGAVLLPAGFLFRRGEDERLRAQLIRDHQIAGVILLPQGASTWTSISLAILLLRMPTPGQYVEPIVLVNGSDIKLAGRRPGDRLQEAHIQELYHRYLQPGVPQAKRISAKQIDGSFNLDPRAYISEERRPFDVSDAIEELKVLDERAQDALENMSAALRKLNN